MKQITVTLLLWIQLSSCGNESNIKDSSAIVTKEGLLSAELIIKPVDRRNLSAHLSYINNSSDTIYIHKYLLPIMGKLQSNLFSLFNTNSLKPINYTGKVFGEYLKTAPDDDEGVLIPTQDEINYVRIAPKERLDFPVNLIDYYNFSEIKSGENVSATVIIYLPAVTSDFKQIFELDSIDQRSKPLYYTIRLGTKNQLDSSRVNFVMP